MTKEELSKSAEERFNKHCAEDYCYPSKPDLDLYKDGYKDGATAICKKILEEIDSHKWDYEDAWDRNFEVILASDIRDFIKNLGVDTND